MNLLSVRDYLQGVLPIDGLWFGIAKMDGRKPKALCLYGTPVRNDAGIKVGGMDCTGYRVKRMSLVLRAGVEPTEAERLACAIHQACRIPVACIGGRRGFMRPVDGEAYPLGADAFGVWEYRMDIELYYELMQREEEEHDI